MQDVPYEEQLVRKGKALEELFAPFWNGGINVLPSPVLWHYRNKIDPAFSPKHYPEPPPKDFQRETVLGFKRPKCWYWPMEIEDCLIGPEDVAPLLAEVRAWVAGSRLPAYDSRRKSGFLKGLLIRRARHTGDRIVALVTAPGEFDAPPFMEAVQRAWPDAGIFRGIFYGSADVTAADELEHLAGPRRMEECLHIPISEGEAPRVTRYSLSPFSFFQTNTLATEVLYGRIRDWVNQCNAAALFDLYGGMGTIAISCCDLVPRVWSVESFVPASEDGKRNALINNAGNIRFVAEDVRPFLRKMLTEGTPPENPAVVLDPPRAGLHPRVLQRMVEWRPPHVLYVSCKPSVLAREMPKWLESYRLSHIEAVDMFPHTPNAEVLASFEALS
jgi:tRNA/tmRNA/rRNA uracil-C5-methylase (TrmA/RlmC/RlmD family)